MLVAPGVEPLEASAVWGDYEWGKSGETEEEADAAADTLSDDAPETESRARSGYRRSPKAETVAFPLPILPLQTAEKIDLTPLDTFQH